MALTTWYMTTDGTFTNDKPFAVNLAWYIVSQDAATNSSVVTFRSIVRTRSTGYTWDGSILSFALNINGNAYSGSTTVATDTLSGWTYTPGTFGVIDDTLCDGGTCVAAELIYEWANLTIPHNSDGSKTVSVTHSYNGNVGGYGPGTVTLNKSIVLDTIPLASTLSTFNSFAIENTAGAIAGNSTIYSASFYNKFILKQSGTERASWSLGQLSAGAYTYGLTLSDAQRNAIFAALPTTTSASFTLELKTYSDSGYTTQVGSTATRTATGTIPASYIPSITTANSGFTWTNKNSALTGLLIQDVSTLTLTLSGGTASTGTTIANYKIRYGAATYTSGSAISQLHGLLTSSGTTYAYYSVQDARGRWSTEISETITINAYLVPQNTGFDVRRNATVTTSADYILKFSNSLYASGNTWTYTLQYYNGSTWVNAKAATAIAAASINSSYTHALPYTASATYSVRAVVADLFNSVTFTDTLSTASYPLVLGPTNAAAGKVPSNGTTYDFEVGINGIKSDGDIKIPYDNSFDFDGTNATIRSNSVGSLVLAGTDVYLRPNGDTTTNQLIIPDVGQPTFAGYTIWTEGNDGAGSGLNADQLDTYHAANTTGAIPISNGTLNTNLNADMLEGYHAANTTGAIPISNGTLNTNLNADMFDGLHIAQGTYTPVVTGATTAGVGTYTLQKGTYTKIGLLVFIDTAVVLTAHTGTGEIRISLPYTSDTTSGFKQPLTITHFGLTLTASHIAYCQVVENTAYAGVVSSAAGASTLGSVAIDGTCSIRISGCYVASS